MILRRKELVARRNKEVREGNKRHLNGCTGMAADRCSLDSRYRCSRHLCILEDSMQGETGVNKNWCALEWERSMVITAYPAQPVQTNDSEPRAGHKQDKEENCSQIGNQLVLGSIRGGCAC